MNVTLEKGLYGLCGQRIAGDGEFRAVAVHRNFDAVDDALFDEYRLFQLRRTLALVSGKSAFYKRLYAAAGVDVGAVRSFADLRRLPFTSGDDLSGSSYGFLCSSQGDVEKPVTFFSSGSTGTKKRVYFSAGDIRRILEFLPRGMNTVVGREEARVQVFLQNSQGRGIGGMLAEGLRGFGMGAWTSDLQDDPEELLRLTRERRVNVWFGDAVTILRATRILAETEDLRGVGMRCVFITMANIPPAMTDYLERTWGCRVSTHYGLTEAGWGLAVDCGVCDGYHYDELDHYIEIVDAQTGAPLPKGRQGEVVLTNLSRDCMPLIRYRTGDIACLTDSVCGSHLDVLGHIVCRKEGAVSIGGRSVYPAMFDQTIFSQPQALDYRVSVGGGRLLFEVEALGGESFPAEELAVALSSLPVMSGLPEVRVSVLPVGALRPFCYEKKRILERDAAKGEQDE